MARLLIVEDEPDLRDMLYDSLQQEFPRLQLVGTGTEALKMLGAQAFDLVLLDWMLPDLSGIELLRRIRRNPAIQDLPVIMLTARGEEHDRVRGLDTGADDYVTKPFSLVELRARIRARLRARKSGNDEVLEYGGLSLNLATARLQSAGEPIELGPTEYRLLQFFMQHPERVYSRMQIIDAVWGINAYIEERTIDVHIRRLRKALASHGHASLLQTVRGMGYRLSST